MRSTIRSKRYALAILILLLFISLLIASAEGNGDDFLQVAFIDVGQGDSIWLHASDDTDILIDGGDKGAGSSVVNYLKQEGIDDIDVMVLSHSHLDHYGGLITVLESDIPISSFIYNGLDNTGPTFNEFLTALAGRGLTLTPVQVGQSFIWGPLDALVLNPPTTLSGDHNEDSVVLLVDYHSTRFLFTGDIEDNAEAGILASETPIAANVLKVAHHGSATSSSQEFLDAVEPNIAVISVGEDNPYGHPNPDTLARLQASVPNVYRTDEDGTVLVWTKGPDNGTTHKIYLPLVMRSMEPPAKITITTVFYDGIAPQDADEYVEFRNDDDHTIQLENWTLSDEENHIFTFPTFEMEPGKICRVYTNQDHPEYCDLNYKRGTGVWNNTGGDCAVLKDNIGREVDEYCYGK